jgi:hypothetical protein
MKASKTDLWKTVHKGLSSSTREEFAQAAYQLVWDDYTLLGDIAQESGLDKPTLKAVIEDAAAREWRREWVEFDQKQAASSQTRSTSSQGPRTGSQSRSSVTFEETGTTTRPRAGRNACPCGAGLPDRRTKYCSPACRQRAYRRRTAS